MYMTPSGTAKHRPMPTLSAVICTVRTAPSNSCGKLWMMTQ